MAQVKETKAPDAERLMRMIEILHPLHRSPGKPGPYDWLAHHHEPGQTFQQYIRSRPVTPRGNRCVIAIQPVGDFTDIQRRIVALTVDFIGRFYNLPVTVLEDIPLSRIPKSARRRHPSWGMEQVLTTYILDTILKPALSRDMAASLALTAFDLWPGRGWNFVFGQASLRERVGVWSMYRNGDPGTGEAGYTLCLIRTLKTAVHEIGHMFSMGHCIRYACGMCGSNHREESDRRPLWFCPECMAKVCWATGADPSARYQALADFCRTNRLEKEQIFYETSLRTLLRLPLEREQGKGSHSE